MITESRVYDSGDGRCACRAGIGRCSRLRGVPFVYVYDATRQRVFARRVEVGDLIDG